MITVRTLADLERLPPGQREVVRAQIAERYRQAVPTPLRPRWDAESRTVAAESLPDFRARLAGSMEVDRRRYQRMRWRWRLDEFAAEVVGPLMRRRSRWYPNNPVNDEILGWPAQHWRQRPADGRTTQVLVWAPRGSAKTTTMKERAFHAGLFGLEAGIVVIASGATAAYAWTRTLEQWCADLPAETRAILGGPVIDGPDEMITLHCDGSDVAYHARGWDSAQIRGLNEGAARPTAAYLDDIESAKTTSSPDVRDRAQAKLLEQVMPMLPNEGGGIVYWSATPVHDDCTSARAVRRAEGLRRWAVSRHRAVLRWPESPRWEECRRIYLDVDGAVASLQARGMVVDPVAVQDEQVSLATEYHDAHADEMDAGAEVMDPHRLPILACYMRRWDIGDEAFEREYQTSPAPRRPGAIFDPQAWVTMYPVTRGRVTADAAPVDAAARNRLAQWIADHPGMDVPAAVVTSGGQRYAIDRPVAHYDPSDGGDPGALAIGCRLPDGRAVVLYVHEHTGRMSAQMADYVATCDAWGADLQAEANMMHEAERLELQRLWADMNRRRVDTDRRPLGLTFQHTHEDKEQRIRSLDTPFQHGRLCVLHGIDDVLARRAAVWDPARNNVDDVLDAVQRVAERCGVGGRTTSLWMALAGRNA